MYALHLHNIDEVAAESFALCLAGYNEHFRLQSARPDDPWAADDVSFVDIIPAAARFTPAHKRFVM